MYNEYLEKKRSCNEIIQSVKPNIVHVPQFHAFPCLKYTEEIPKKHFDSFLYRFTREFHSYFGHYKRPKSFENTDLEYIGPESKKPLKLNKCRS